MALDTLPSANAHVPSLADDPSLSKYIKKVQDRPCMNCNTCAKDIPVVSLASLVSDCMGGEDGRRQQAVGEVMKAGEEWGMFQVVEHGVPEELVERMAELTHQFFGLPSEKKLEYACESNSTGKFCGFAYGSFLKGDLEVDWRELLMIDVLPLSSRNENGWPMQPPDFRETLLQYSQEMLRVAEVLVAAISEGLGLSADAVKEASGEIEERVLLNYYPACQQPEVTLGLRRHTDYGTITLVYQDAVGGLQTIKDGDKWVSVEPLKGAFVVILGAHMNVLSNNRLKTPEHRVVVNSAVTRVSIGAFFNPAPYSIVRSLVDEETELSSEPCTFAEFYRRRFPQK